MKLKDVLEYSKGTLIGDFDLNMEITNFSIDSRNIAQNGFFVPLKGENSDGHNYIKSAFENGAIGTFTSKDIENFEDKIIIKVPDTLKAIQDVCENFRIANKQIPLIAITGSVGKTTTKDMIYSVLSKKYNTLKTKGNFNNNIGMPLTLINYTNEDMVVLEMGMNSFGEISFLSKIAKPDVGVIINVGHSHIGKLGSRENILKAKLEILDGISEEGTLVINQDNDMLSTVKNINQKIITFGFENEADIYAYNIKIEDSYTIFNIKEEGKEYQVKLNLIGEKFISNALAAWTIGKLYNVSPEDRIDALLNCEFTKMRMNIEKVNDITLIDDCYNASPESMKLALIALSKQEKTKVAILGDMFELGEYAESLHIKVGENVQDLKIDKLITVGELGKSIAEGAKNKGMAAQNILSFKNLEEFLNNINKCIIGNEAILVKASRGMQFEKIVECLKK